MLTTQIPVYHGTLRLQQAGIFQLYYLHLSNQSNNSTDTNSTHGGNFILKKYCECWQSIAHGKNLPMYFPCKERSSGVHGNHFKPSSGFNLSLCALKWVQALSWYKLKMKDVDKNFSYVSNDLWLFCLDTATGLVNKALGFGLTNNSLEKQLQLDWRLWRKHKDQRILWINAHFNFPSWNVCGNM